MKNRIYLKIMTSELCSLHLSYVNYQVTQLQWKYSFQTGAFSYLQMTTLKYLPRAESARLPLITNTGLTKSRYFIHPGGTGETEAVADEAQRQGQREGRCCAAIHWARVGSPSQYCGGWKVSGRAHGVQVIVSVFGPCVSYFIISVVTPFKREIIDDENKHNAC